MPVFLVSRNPKAASNYGYSSSNDIDKREVFFNPETPETNLCNTTRALRLNKLALLNVHREVSISADEILDERATKPRRLDFKLW